MSCHPLDNFDNNFHMIIEIIEINQSFKESILLLIAVYTALNIKIHSKKLPGQNCIKSRFRDLASTRPVFLSPQTRNTGQLDPYSCHY